jgi:hypothetical protein
MIYIGNNEFRTAKSQIYLGNAGLGDKYTGASRAEGVRLFKAKAIVHGKARNSDLMSHALALVLRGHFDFF